MFACPSIPRVLSIAVQIRNLLAQPGYSVHHLRQSVDKEGQIIDRHWHTPFVVHTPYVACNHDGAWHTTRRYPPTLFCHPPVGNRMGGRALDQSTIPLCRFDMATETPCDRGLTGRNREIGGGRRLGDMLTGKVPRASVLPMLKGSTASTLPVLRPLGCNGAFDSPVIGTRPLIQ